MKREFLEWWMEDFGVVRFDAAFAGIHYSPP